MAGSSNFAAGSFQMQYMLTVNRSEVNDWAHRTISDEEWDLFTQTLRNDMESAEDGAVSNALEAILGDDYSEAGTHAPPETDTEDASSAPATDAASAAGSAVNHLEWENVINKRMRLPVYATADGSTIIARGTYFQVYGGGPEGGYLKPYPKSYVGLPYTMHPDSIWRIQRTWAQRYHVVETLRGVLHQTSEGGCLLVRFVPSATP